MSAPDPSLYHFAINLQSCGLFVPEARALPVLRLAIVKFESRITKIIRHIARNHNDLALTLRLRDQRRPPRCQPNDSIFITSDCKTTLIPALTMHWLIRFLPPRLMG